MRTMARQRCVFGAICQELCELFRDLLPGFPGVGSVGWTRAMRRRTMHWKHRGLTLIGMLLLAIPGVVKVMTLPVSAQVSQVATTQVTDTVFLADGTTATGTVIVSWQAFTTPLGQSVPAGTTSATIGAGGVLSLQLVPNAGAT